MSNWKKQYYQYLENFDNKTKLSSVELKQIRKSFNLSQRCFAEMLGISVKTLQNYEIDRRAIISPAKSLFLFARDNKQLFLKKYSKEITNIRAFRQ